MRGEGRGRVSFVAEFWNEVRPFAVPLLADLAKWLLLFLAVGLLHLFLRALLLMGYNPSRIAVFEAIDYWLAVSLIAVFAVNLFMRIVVESIRIFIESFRRAKS